MRSLEFETEFEYPTDERGIVVSVELQAGRTVRLHATVDTGAQNCLFQADYAEGLGLTLLDGEQRIFSTAAGQGIVGYGHEVTVTVLGYSINSVVYFTDHFGFSRNVLGRRGWLDPFKVGLIHYGQRLFIGRNGT